MAKKPNKCFPQYGTNKNRPLFWPKFKTVRKTVQSVSHVFMQGYSIKLLSRLVLYMYLR